MSPDSSKNLAMKTAILRSMGYTRYTMAIPFETAGFGHSPVDHSSQFVLFIASAPGAGNQGVGTMRNVMVLSHGTSNFPWIVMDISWQRRQCH